MFDVGLHRGRHLEDLFGGEAGGRGHGHDGRDAHGERARLVEGHRVDAGQPLQGVGVADEDPEGGGPSAAHHHRHRRGQAHGTRAGHEQDGDRAQDRRAEVRADEPPAQKGRGGHQQHDRHEHRADAVGESFERRLGAQGLVHHLLEPGQDRLGGHGTHLDDEYAVAVARAAP